MVTSGKICYLKWLFNCIINFRCFFITNVVFTYNYNNIKLKIYL